MTRPILLAICAIALLVALGTWAQSWMSTPLAAQPETPVAVVAPVAAPEPTPPAAVTATVLEVAGGAERFEPDTQIWTPLESGSSLEESALLRTRNGSIRITIGTATEVEVSPDSRFRLEEMTETSSKVSLEEGRVSARVKPGSGARLAVGVLGSDSEAVSDGGEFSILRNASAGITVASQAGSVTVSGQDTHVVVHAGELATAAAGQAPSPAIKIPGSLFVKLRLAGKRKLRTRHTLVTGTASPGSVVTVNGIETAALDGTFRVKIPLSEGENSVKVVAHDVLGRKRTDSLTGLIVDSTPPQLRGKVQW